MRGLRPFPRRSSRLPFPFLTPRDVGAPGAETSVRAVPDSLEHSLALAQQRLAVPIVGFLLLFLVVVGRLGILMGSGPFSEAAVAPTVSSSDAPYLAPVASRADIVDRRGEVIATSLPLFSLCVDSPKVLEPSTLAAHLRPVLPDLDPVRVTEAAKSGKRCALVRRRLTPRQAYEVNSLGIVGLEIVPDEARSYPAGPLAAHVVGYTDTDNRGIAGIEREFDSSLSHSSQPLVLSLDLRVQALTHQALADTITTFHALGGASVVMDLATGEILALVSLPDFDPQNRENAPPEALFNRATLGVYEMGSTFKVITTAMALDSGLVKPRDTFDTLSPLWVGSKQIRDFHPATHRLNVAEIMMESSNIGAALMADRVGGARQRAFFEALDLDKPVLLETPERGRPLMPSAKDWRESTVLTTAFGHGIAVSAVRLATAVGTLVRDGEPVHPTLLKRATSSGAGSAERDEPRLVSPRVSAQVRAMMRLVVRSGTARKADVPGYLVAGKTGTADKVEGHEYTKDARLSSFIGVFPAPKPRYLVIVLVDEPKGTMETHGQATGGWTAAQTVGSIIEHMGPLVGLSPQTPEESARADAVLLGSLGPGVVPAEASVSSREGR